MKQEDKNLKDLLLKDLCARLPYGVKVESVFINPDTKEHKSCGIEVFNATSLLMIRDGLGEFKPYLFPLSSISEELKNFIRWKLTTPKYDSFDEESLEDLLNNNMQIVHYCYEHHLDINGLIERGLALEAPEGMYN